jgi:hypothetical protein
VSAPVGGGGGGGRAGGGGERGRRRRRRRRRRRAGGRDRRPTSSNDNQPQLGESAAALGEVELAATPGERGESAGAPGPGESTTTTCRATARRRTMTTRWQWRTFSSLRTNDQGGLRGGEEEAPDAVSALAMSLPRDPTMRSSSRGAGGGSSRSDHRRAVAEEDGERDGGCSGSAVGINSRRVTCRRRPGRGGGAARGAGEGVDRRHQTHRGGLGP